MRRALAGMFLVTALWLVAAPPASAYKGWSHATAIGKRSCAVGCHAEDPPTNATCTGCHAGFSTSGDRWCWTCHEPGQSTSAWQLSAGCTSSCHLWTAVSDLPSYTTDFAHGGDVHLGSSGYDKTCTDCHGVSLGAASPGSSPHHDTEDAAPPTCAGCHDGSIASAPSGHEAFGDVCTACHDGMDRPSGDCTACHTGNEGSSIPQVDYDNDLACADAACHGAVAVHSDTPVASLPCTTCHTGHYADLAACADCHPGPEAYHHGTAQARPLADCAGCHDGSIGVARASHATLPCVICHAEMGVPSVPAVCSRCHFRNRFGAEVCTTCHSPDGLTGREQVHTATPQAGLTCGDCHEGHNADLGACDSCHARTAETHHGTASSAGATVLTLAGPDRAVRAGAAARLAGSLSCGGAPVAGATVRLQERRLGDDAFVDVATLFTGVDGGFSHQVTALRGAQYRAVFQGWSWSTPVVTVQEPALARVTVKVAQAVKLRARPGTVRAKARVKFSGSLSPSARQYGAKRPPVRLRVERKRGARWVKVATVRRAPAAGGGFSWTWRPAKAGSYRVTASVAATADLLAASARVKVRVR